MAKSFKELSEKEILALAISQEEEDGRIYGEFAERMRPTHPKTAEALAAMRDEESSHRHQLMETYRQKFGDYIPLIRRQDVKGFVSRKPIWMSRVLTVDQVRKTKAPNELLFCKSSSRVWPG
jgi:rubrerythrin